MNKTVLLVYPENSPIPHTVNFPLSIYALGGYLKKKGYNILYFDERTDDMKKLEEYLAQEPLLVGLSTMTSYQIISAVNLSKFIKKNKPGMLVVWGGTHPSLCPSQTIEQDYVDFVVIGEGEKTLLELVDALSEDRKNLEKIDGLVWKKGTSPVINKERGFMNFDEAVFPYENIDKETLAKYLIKDKHIKSIKPVFYQSSRGCLHNCAFCYNRVFNKRNVRERSLPLVKEELKKLKDQGVTEISFCDDDVAISKERLSKVNEITKELGMKWHASIRVNYIDEKTAKELEEGGCQYIFFGIESGNQETLNYMKKGTTVGQIKQCVEVIAKTSIIPNYSFVFGFPREPKNHMKDSFELVDWMLKIDPRANIILQVYSPIPGTEFYEISLQEGFKPPEKVEDWSKMVAHEVNTPWVKDKALLRNLYVISLFAFRFDDFLRSKIFYIPHLIAKWRWKHKFFKFGYERALFVMAEKATMAYYALRRKL